MLPSGGAPEEGAAAAGVRASGAPPAASETLAERPIALVYDGPLVGVAEASADDLRPVKVLAPRPSTEDGR